MQPSPPPPTTTRRTQRKPPTPSGPSLLITKEQHPFHLQQQYRRGNNTDSEQLRPKQQQQNNKSSSYPDNANNDTSKIIPKLTKAIIDDDVEAQLEAVGLLTNYSLDVNLNIAAASSLIQLLQHDDRVAEQALWLLGNMAADNTRARDAILMSSSRIWPGLVHYISHNMEAGNMDVLRICTWAMSNICDVSVDSRDIVLLLVKIKELLSLEDTEILSHTCWALSHLCDSVSTHIPAIMDNGICAILVQLLNHRNWRVVKPALRAVGNIVCCEEERDFTQTICELGAVDSLKRLVRHANRELQKEACWTLSNIAAGTSQQIAYLIHNEVIKELVAITQAEDVDPDVKSEACWVVLNATSCGSDAQLVELAENNAIDVLNMLLHPSMPATANNTTVINMALECAEKMLTVGEALGKTRDVYDVTPTTTTPATTTRGNTSSTTNNRVAIRIAPNPFADAISSSNLIALRSNTKLGLSKRAGNIFMEHYVTCALCNQSFSRRSGGTIYCNECACHVCNGCDCTRFHMASLDEMWKDLDVEGNGTTNKSSGKKKKGKKKAPTTNTSEGTTITTTTTTTPTDNKNQTTPANVEYVDFLMQSGSIIALAAMMDAAEE